MEVVYGIIKIVIFLFLSALIAYVGDYVGYKAGKMKISLLGFRPRKTSRVIAVLTGVLITIITLGLFLVFSEEARIALFELEELNDEIKVLTDTKDKLDERIYGLKEEVEQLVSHRDALADAIDITFKRSSFYPITFEADQVLAYGLIKKGSSEEDVISLLDSLKEEIAAELYGKNIEMSRILESRGVEAPENLDAKIRFLNSGYRTIYNKQFIDLLLNNSEFDQVIGIYSVANAFVGDDLRVDFTVEKNKVIFFDGQTIVEDTVDATLPRKDIWEFMVKLLLSDVRETSLNNGMLPDPKTGLGVDIPNPSVWDLCDEIMHYSSDVTVRIVATEDIYTLGPLKFDIEIIPAE